MRNKASRIKNFQEPQEITVATWTLTKSGEYHPLCIKLSYEADLLNLKEVKQRFKHINDSREIVQIAFEGHLRAYCERLSSDGIENAIHLRYVGRLIVSDLEKLGLKGIKIHQLLLEDIPPDTEFTGPYRYLHEWPAA